MNKRLTPQKGSSLDDGLGERDILRHIFHFFIYYLTYCTIFWKKGKINTIQ